MACPCWPRPDPVFPPCEPQFLKGNITPSYTLEGFDPWSRVSIYQGLFTSLPQLLRMIFCTLRGASAFFAHTPPPPPFLYPLFISVSYFTIKFWYHLCVWGGRPRGPCGASRMAGVSEEVMLGGSHLSVRRAWPGGGVGGATPGFREGNKSRRLGQSVGCMTTSGGGLHS